MAEIHLQEQMSIDLGSKTFDKKEIIEFAKVNDPLDFHLDPKAAAKSQFKGLVCSGSQAFNYFYVKRWIPLFGHTVLAGVSVNNWLFKLPIYVDEEIQCQCKLANLKKLSDEQRQIIQWDFSFKNVKNQEVQALELTIMHRIRNFKT